ncbi:efflux RND transporter permease subunit [Thermopetrobacter sp. TC1]|uniref:efflux RND transporter permease subunit n=1 Tax=Thermopetrobacter sp. TC1 TaxID=1495045 RepID=UPI00056E9C75|nr:efflux RND transporter permease subunit [Thermopetrobacter sp. TC1]
MKALIRLFIRHHVFAAMLSAVVVLFGVISFSRIGVDRYPNIDFPMISVVTTLPGASPEVVDASVTNVIESAVNAVPGIRHITSRSLPNASVVLIMFELTKDIDVAFNEVQARVSQVVSQLPKDADAPSVRKVEFGAFPVLWLALQGENHTLKDLSLYARRVLKKRLENIDGVGEVKIAGRRERTIRVELDVFRMAAYGLTVQDVMKAFAARHFQMPGGQLVNGPREMLIKLDLEYHDPAALRDLVITWRKGAPVRLRDIAHVRDALDDPRKLARYNDRPTIALGIVKVTGSNAVAVIDRVKQRLKDEIVPSLPPGMSLSVATDESDLILELVRALEEHLVLGTVLTAFIVWLFLKSLRATLIVSVAIPVSLLGAVAVMYFFGYTFNSLTLLALLLLIGVVVDDAIVVLENIYRHMEAKPEGDPARAAAEGGSEVLVAVMAATFTLVSIFAPVVFMGGIIGRFFRSFGVVVTFGVLISLFVALTLTPVLCARWLRPQQNPGLITRALERAFRGMERGYLLLLKGALRVRWLVLVLALASLLPVGYFIGQLGKSFLPPEDEGRFVITFKTPLGSSLEYTDTRLRLIEAVLKKQPEIDGHLSTIGTGVTGRVNRGTIYVRLKPREERRRHMYAIIEDLRRKLADIPGVEAFPAPVPVVGGQRGEPLQFVVSGPSLEVVARTSGQLLKRLQAYPELGRVDLDLQLNMPQLVPEIDRIRAAQAGLTPLDVALALNVLAGGVDIAKYNDLPGDGERYDIRLKALEGQLRERRDLGALYLRNAAGKLVQLSSVVKLKERVGPAEITRLDLKYSGPFYATPTVPLGTAVKIVEQEAAKILPPGYAVRMIGRAEEFGRTLGYITFVFATAIILVYMVLASQFNSMIQPFVLMLAQPLAMTGGVAALWLAGLGLNIFSMIGLVLLMGLVAKNSILLIEFTNQMRARGMGITEALLHACPIRMRPVLMTSAAIIVAMLPAALGYGAGADTNQPLAVAVIGGMISSTLLTLVVVPAAYSLVEGALARLHRRGKRKRHGTAGSSADTTA